MIYHTPLKPLLAGLLLALGACSSLPDQTETAPTDNQKDHAACKTPGWFRHQAEHGGSGWLTGFGEAATVEQARQRAMQEIMLQLKLDIDTYCRDLRESSSAAGDGFAAYSEDSRCTTRTQVRASDIRFDDLQPPEQCGDRVWVKLGLDNRSLRSRATVSLPFSAASGPAFCAGVSPLTRSPFCAWLADNFTGLGPVPVDLSREEGGWMLHLGKQDLPLNGTPLAEVLAWNSEPRCRNWFHLQQNGQTVEQLTAPAEYQMTLQAVTGADPYISVLTVYPDGRSQLLLPNILLTHELTETLNGRLEPGQPSSRDVVIAIRHAQPLDWSAFRQQPADIVTETEMARLPDVLRLLAVTDYTNMCVQTVRLQDPRM